MDLVTGGVVRQGVAEGEAHVFCEGEDGLVNAGAEIVPHRA